MQGGSRSAAYLVSSHTHDALQHHRGVCPVDSPLLPVPHWTKTKPPSNTPHWSTYVCVCVGGGGGGGIKLHLKSSLPDAETPCTHHCHTCSWLD